MKLRPGMRKKENGSIEFRFTVNGKRYSVTGASVPDCVRKQAELIERVSQFVTNNKTITLDQYFLKYIHELSLKRRASTCHEYEYQYNSHIKGTSLGTTKLVKITRMQVKDFRSSVRPKKDPNRYSVNLCNNIATLISMILSDAEEDGIIQKNVAYGIERLTENKLSVEEKKPDVGETIHRALTKEETRKFLDAARSAWYYELYYFLLCTGIRTGEACALYWHDIDYRNGVINIKRTTSGHKVVDIIETSPKTPAGTREVPLSSGSIKALRMQKEKLIKLGKYNPNGHVFISSRLVPTRPNSVQSTLRCLLRKTDIEYFSPHCLRDTFATRWIEQCGNMNTLKTILGHSSIKMTMDHYAKVLKETKIDEINGMQFVG